MVYDSAYKDNFRIFIELCDNLSTPKDNHRFQ